MRDFRRAILVPYLLTTATTPAAMTVVRVPIRYGLERRVPMCGRMPPLLSLPILIANLICYSTTIMLILRHEYIGIRRTEIMQIL